MIKILEREGELLITLTDVMDRADLTNRIALEDQEKIKRLQDTPFWAFDPSSEDLSGVMEEETKTYREWMDECMEWVDEAIGYDS